jgi:2-haloacid dehalogenase
MAEIRVFLFDLGGVLTRWEGEPFVRQVLHQYVADAQEHEEEFFRLFWECNNESDKNTLAQATELYAARYPFYANVFWTCCERYAEIPRSVIQGTVDILSQIKASGYKAYAASNWSTDTFALTRNVYMPYLPLFDGMQISGEIGLIKPDPAFFERMMRVFDFKAEEAIFIDDRAVNVDAACVLGIDGIHFESPEQLRRELEVRRIRSFQ